MIAPFGALFQEIHTPVYPSIYDTLKVAMLLRHLWIVCSFLLAAAYASNLKAAFVIRSFEDIPESIQEISDWYGILQAFAPVHWLSILITCRGYTAMVSAQDVQFLEYFLAAEDKYKDLTSLSQNTNGVFYLS